MLWNGSGMVFGGFSREFREFPVLSGLVSGSFREFGSGSSQFKNTVKEMSGMFQGLGVSLGLGEFEAVLTGVQSGFNAFQFVSRRFREFIVLGDF